MRNKTQTKERKKMT